MNRPRDFYYITHIDNLKSILKNGILSRTQAKSNFWVRLGFINGIKSIHAEDIVQRRKNKPFKDRSLWEYANLYFQPRNPMLYRVIREFGAENIAVLQVKSDILEEQDIGITDGNAASAETQFFEDITEGLNSLDSEQLKKDFWNDDPSSKRKIMAELLVYKQIPPDKIIGIYVADEKVREKIKMGGLNVIPNKKMFFMNDFQKRISDNITITKGDMFFSKMQTFTISVNTVGIMGKGLASRAKYQFPDVYVLYQDICRQRKLKMGAPYLYKREINFEKTLTEDTQFIPTENGNRWFLLFPTKNHWKESSPIQGIDTGLQWLLNNYENLGIKSIALPSLGCGLGGLSWKDVGPLMCKYLNQMDIKSCIYLPNEKDVPSEQWEPEFLFNNK